MTQRVLDRIPEFDERSRLFAVSNLRAVERSPRSNIWKTYIQLDQGQEGACVGFSWAHRLGSEPEATNNAVEDAFSIDRDTAENIYHTAQALDDIPGEGYSGTSVLAGAKAVQSLFPEKGMSYHWGFSLYDVVDALGYIGPVVLGINWYQSCFDPDEEGRIHISGSVAGGHAILADGVDIDSKVVTLKNSWGKTWGIEGSCYITFGDLDRLLHEGGEACIPLFT